MRLIKIAVATLDTTVGAVRTNTDRALETAHAMAAEGVNLGCFQEQVIGGYPPEDLIQWRAYVAAQRRELERFAAETSEHSTVFVIGCSIAVGAQLYNCAAVVHGGEILGLVPKEKLPTYEIFYEARTFSNGGPGLRLDADGVPLGDYLFRFDFGVVAVEVCEDLWSPDGPIRRRCYAGAEVVVNISASPYRIGMVRARREMLGTRSADNQAVLVYANALGAQDGLVFDGGGYVLQNGREVLNCRRLESGFETCIVDVDRTHRLRQQNTTWRDDANDSRWKDGEVPVIRSAHSTGDRESLAYPRPSDSGFFLPPDETVSRSPRAELLDDLFEVLALGTADYFRKTGAFDRFGVALSGGRDSMLTLLVAWRAAERLGGELDPAAMAEHISDSVHAFYMPSRYSTEGTRSAGATLCEELGIPLTTVAIDDAFDREAEAVAAMLGDREVSELTLQNIQARLRAQRMWNWANSASALFLQSGDMSERAVGYTTIGGDLEGGLSVIGNLPKTVVVAMLERLSVRFDLEGVRQTLETEPGP